MGFYIYNDNGEQIGYVTCVDINDAWKEAMLVTGLDRDNLSVERA